MGEKVKQSEFKSLAVNLRKKIMALFITFLIILNIVILFVFLMQFKTNTKENFINEGVVVADNVQQALDEEWLMRNQNIRSGDFGGRLKNIQESHGRQMNSFRRIDSLIRGLSATSIYLLDEDLQVVSDRTPQNLNLLLDDYEGDFHYVRDEKNIISYQDKLITPIEFNENKTYHMVMESPEVNMITSLTPLIIIPVVSSLFALIIIYFISRTLVNKIVRPIEKITDVTKSYRKGDFSQRSDVDQQDEIGILSDNIDNFAIELEEAKRLREEEYNNQKEFIANISHELRTPVSVMALTVEKIKDMNICEDREALAYVDHLREEAEHLKVLVDDLITLTKLENPKFKLNKEDINLRSVIDDSLRSLRFRVKDKDIQITIDLPHVIKFHGDYERLRQLMTILLDNAIKFSATAGEIAIYGDEHRINIKDYGKGISQEDVAQIFNRYYRAESEVQGSGLGLAIAKQITTRHDMDIEVASEEGQYTEFSLKF